MRAMDQLSIDNYFAVVKPKLTEREKWVLQAIKDIGHPVSSEQVAKHLGVGINIVSGRMTGLKNKELIVLDHTYKKVGGTSTRYWKPNTEREYGET